MASADHQFESTRSMHQSPKGIAGATSGLPAGGLSHIQSIGVPATAKPNVHIPNIFHERHQDRQMRIQLTDVKRRREDSLDHHQGHPDIHTGQPCAENSLSPLRRELKNSSLTPVKNIFVETGQCLSRGSVHPPNSKQQPDSATKQGY